jgi:hypothetical protein
VPVTLSCQQDQREVGAHACGDRQTPDISPITSLRDDCLGGWVLCDMLFHINLQLLGFWGFGSPCGLIASQAPPSRGQVGQQQAPPSIPLFMAHTCRLPRRAYEGWSSLAGMMGGCQG